MPLDEPAVLVLEAFARSTPPEVKLTSVTTYAVYAGHLRRAAAALGLGWVKWTPHSARAGFATERRLRGDAFSQIKEDGRWKSDSSFRVYLDEATAMSLKQQLSGIATTAEWLEGDFARRYPWW